MHDVEERRTDVRAARGRVTAAQHVVRDSYADYLPLLQAVVTPFAQSAAVPAIEGLPVDRTGFSEAHAAESNPRTANPTRTFRTVDPLISSVPT